MAAMDTAKEMEVTLDKKRKAEEHQPSVAAMFQTLMGEMQGVKQVFHDQTHSIGQVHEIAKQALEVSLQVKDDHNKLLERVLQLEAETKKIKEQKADPLQGAGDPWDKTRSSQASGSSSLTPPPGLGRKVEQHYLGEVPKIFMRGFPENTSRTEVTTTLDDLIAQLKPEVKQLIKEHYCPGKYSNVGIIKVEGDKNNMWTLFTALKSLAWEFEGQQLRPTIDKAKPLRVRDGLLGSHVRALRAHLHPNPNSQDIGANYRTGEVLLGRTVLMQVKLVDDQPEIKYFEERIDKDVGKGFSEEWKNRVVEAEKAWRASKGL